MIVRNEIEVACHNRRSLLRVVVTKLVVDGRSLGKLPIRALEPEPEFLSTGGDGVAFCLVGALSATSDSSAGSRGRTVYCGF